MKDPFHCFKNHLHHWGALPLSNLLSAWAEHEQGHLAVFANKVSIGEKYAKNVNEMI